MIRQLTVPAISNICTLPVQKGRFRLIGVNALAQAGIQIVTRALKLEIRYGKVVEAFSIYSPTFVAGQNIAGTWMRGGEAYSVLLTATRIDAVMPLPDCIFDSRFFITLNFLEFRAGDIFNATSWVIDDLEDEMQPEG